MKLIQADKRFELHIDSYEFPYDENGANEDNNWLNVAVEWEDEVLVENAVSPCLLTSELEDLIRGLGKVLLNECYQSAFLEPDLEVSAMPVQEQVQLAISYAKKGRSRFYMDALISKQELDEIISDLHEMSMRFPQRKAKLLH